MGANDVARVVGRTTEQIAEDRIARLNEALAARERGRPVMSAVPAYEDARRERARALSRAFVEREKNRDHEITPMEAIIEDNENLGNRRTASVLKLLQLGEAAAGGLTAKPIASHKVIPGGLPIYYAVHGSDTGHALTTARTGELQNPAFAVRSTVGASLATAPDGPMGGSGVTFVGRKQTITPGTDRRVVYSDHDFHSTGRSEFLSTIKEYYRQQTGRELTKAEFQKAAKDRSPLLNDIIDAAYQTMHEADVSRAQRRGNYATTSRQAEGFRAELDAGIEKVLSSERNPRFRSSIANDYNEAKINESIPLSDLAVLVDTQRSFPNYERLVQMGLSPKRPVSPQEVVDAMKQSGAQVIEYNGTTPRGFLDALNEANAFFVNGAQQDAKGGQARKELHASEGGGDVGEESVPRTPEEASEETPAPRGGPRIVINPSTFKNKKDALCVAFNEAFRVLMELNGFEPMADPTAEQRRFFSDTAYAKDELQLRRTILARIATFDTSVKDPTPEQVEETIEFLHTVLEIGAPQNEWEQRAVQRLIDALGNQPGSSTPTISSSRTTR